MPRVACTIAGHRNVILIAAMLVSVLAAAAFPFADAEDRSPPGSKLASLKAEHPTQLRVRGPAPAIYEPDVPDGVTQIHYVSCGRKLLAWLIKSKSRKAAPALLYAHHGFALTHVDLEDIKPFISAGYTVLLPSWRAENGNPGEFERYFGEVDDARAALNYLRNVPGIDQNRVFAAGDTTGGTTILLLSESGVRLKRAAVCSAFPDIGEAIHRGLTPQRTLFPYDWTSDMENSLRSPGRHIQDLCCPVNLYNSDSDPLYVRQAAALQRSAKAGLRTITIRVCAHTDQRSVVSRAVHAMLAEFGKS